jgi:hypothetical protein
MRLCRERVCSTLFVLACWQPVLEGGALPREAVPYIADGLGRDAVPRCDGGRGVQGDEVVYLDGGGGVERRARAYFSGRRKVGLALFAGPVRRRGHAVRAVVTHIEDGACRDCVLASEYGVREGGAVLVDLDGFGVREVAAA